MIRPTEDRDVDAITNIYNQATYLNLEMAPVSSENRRDWLAVRRDPAAAWVYTLAPNDVAGYCGLSPFSLRPLSKTVAEIALFVDQRHRSRFSAIAIRLLAHMVDVARARGLRSLLATPLGTNTPSIVGLAAYGFLPTATLREGVRTPRGWGDMQWMQKDLLLPDPQRFHRIVRSAQSDIGEA